MGYDLGVTLTKGIVITGWDRISANDIILLCCVDVGMLAVHVASPRVGVDQGNSERCHVFS